MGEHTTQFLDVPPIRLIPSLAIGRTARKHTVPRVAPLPTAHRGFGAGVSSPSQCANVRSVRSAGRNARSARYRPRGVADAVIVMRECVVSAMR